VLVALLGTRTGVNPTTALKHFEHLWTFCACMAALAGLVATQLRKPAVVAAAVEVPATGRSEPAALEPAHLACAVTGE
jgi:hypothetical protein